MGKIGSTGSVLRQQKSGGNDLEGVVRGGRKDACPFPHSVKDRLSVTALRGKSAVSSENHSASVLSQLLLFLEIKSREALTEQLAYAWQPMLQKCRGLSE